MIQKLLTDVLSIIPLFINKGNLPLCHITKSEAFKKFKRIVCNFTHNTKYKVYTKEYRSLNSLYNPLDEVCSVISRSKLKSKDGFSCVNVHFHLIAALTKMVTAAQKAFCILELAECKSLIQHRVA